jgi:hypothetical protein
VNVTAVQAFNDASMQFQKKMIANGGLGQETYLPEGVSIRTMAYDGFPSY